MKVYFGKEIPQLEKTKCSVVQTEIATGIILATDGSRYFNDFDEPFILIFDSIEDAKEFSENKIAERPEIECNVYDHSAKFIERISK